MPHAQKNILKPWQKEAWCIPSVSAKFVWRMEDILDLYAEPDDAQYPLVCFDESPYQLVSEVCQPLPVRSGQPRRYDYEYRCGAGDTSRSLTDAQLRTRYNQKVWK